MGDRSNIRLTYSDGQHVCFYTHWGGSELKDTLKAALQRGRDRWDDESYLARIIFSEMIKEDVDGLTGYGIAPYLGEENNETLNVNLPKKTVALGDHNGDYSWTFEEYTDHVFF